MMLVNWTVRSGKDDTQGRAGQRGNRWETQREQIWNNETREGKLNKTHKEQETFTAKLETW